MKLVGRLLLQWIALFYLTPTFTLHQIVFLLNPSWYNFGFVIAALLFDACVFICADGTITSKRNDVLLSILQRLRNYRFQEIPVQNLIPPEAVPKLYRGVYEPSIHWGFLERAGSVWGQVRVFSVMPVGDDAPLQNLVAVQDLDGYCTVLIPTGLAKMTAYQRFQLLHEVGHATINNALQLSRLAGNPVFAFFCVWSLLMFGLVSIFALFGVTLMLLTQWYIRTRFKESPNNLIEYALFNEMAADHFAVTHSTEESLRRIERILDRAPILDSRLTEETNVRRKTALLDNVRRRIAGVELLEPPIQVWPSHRIFWLNLASLVAIALLWSNKSAWVLLTAIIVVVVLVFLVSLLFADNRDKHALVRSRLDELVQKGTSAAECASA